jgi:hypothetical protein
MQSLWTHRRLRLLLAGVATLVTGAALASAALAGIRALDLGPSAASQYPNKVTVCHRTHSKKHPWVKIRISPHALKAHLRHADFVVDEAHPCPPTPAAGAKNHKQHGKGKHHQKAAKTNHGKQHGKADKTNHGKQHGKADKTNHGKHHEKADKTNHGKHQQKAAKTNHQGGGNGHGKK